MGTDVDGHLEGELKRALGLQASVEVGEIGVLPLSPDPAEQVEQRVQALEAVPNSVGIDQSGPRVPVAQPARQLLAQRNRVEVPDQGVRFQPDPGTSVAVHEPDR